jgi:hypothetical protein
MTNFGIIEDIITESFMAGRYMWVKTELGYEFNATLVGNIEENKMANYTEVFYQPPFIVNGRKLKREDLGMLFVAYSIDCMEEYLDKMLLKINEQKRKIKEFKEGIE